MKAIAATGGTTMKELSALTLATLIAALSRTAHDERGYADYGQVRDARASINAHEGFAAWHMRTPARATGARP